MSRMWKGGALAVLVAAAALVSVSVAPAQPAGQTFQSSQKGVSASAFWESCMPDTPSDGLQTCTYTELFVFDGRERSADTGRFRGTRICLLVDTETFEEYPGGGQGPGGDVFEYESGCATARRGTLSVSNDLSRAALPATTVPLDTFRCTFDDATGEEHCDIISSRNVVVAAEWTATGSLARFSERFKFEDENCSESYSARGTRRQAVASARLDGAELGNSSYGEISRASFQFKSTCAVGG